MDRVLEQARRAHAAAPDDPGARDELARALLRSGERLAALELLGVRWEIDAKLPDLVHAGRGGGQPAGPDEVRALVAEDLARLDPFALLAAFPRTQSGALRMNTSRALRRYPIHEAGSPHRRLLLLAWTPGTSSLWQRPGDRGQRLLTVELVTRSTRVVPLSPGPGSDPASPTSSPSDTA